MSRFLIQWSAMTRREIEQERDQIIAQLKHYVPKLVPLFELDAPLREYSRQLYNFSISELQRTRQDLLKTIIQEKIRELFGGAAAELKINFEEKLAFNIADHHQVLNHPVLISSNVLSSVDKFLQPTKQDATITISSGDVPPNNFFSKNGFQLHGKRVPIFSTAEREYCSYYLPKRDFNFVDRLKKSDRFGEFDKEEQAFLEQEYARISALDFSRCSNYNDQISVVVRDTWPRLFEEKLRQTLPELLYVTQEELTSRALLKLLREDNIVSASILDPDFRKQVIEAFRGIVVAWREDEHKGTHFFWRKYPGEPRALRMYIAGDKLVPDDERFRDLAVPLDRDTLAELLRSKEIYPSLFLIFAVLHFFSGAKPLVGHGSLMYLALMKERWLKVLKGSRFEDEQRDIEGVGMSGLVAGLPIFFKRTSGQFRTLYGYDIVYEGGVKEEYLRRLFDMKLKDLMTVSVADMYPYCSSKYIPEEKRLHARVTTDELASLVFDWS